MVVNDVKYVYTTEGVAHTKKGELKRWFKECEDQGVTIRVYPDIPKTDSHSNLEILKFLQYTAIANDIKTDIIANERSNVVSKIDRHWHIAIEGYSYSSAAGPLIDLVTFGTTLRHTLNQWLPLNVDWYYAKLSILQPTEVKQQAAAMVYPPIIKGKKVEYRNADGIAGGSFKKPQIYQALLDHSGLKDDKWVNFIRGHSEEILEMKSIPKPIEDINDAKTLYEIIKGPKPLDK